MVRVDVNSGEGSRVAQAFGVRGVPILLVLDGDDKTVLTQVGRIQRAAVAASIDSLDKE